MIVVKAGRGEVVLSSLGHEKSDGILEQEDYDELESRSFFLLTKQSIRALVALD